MSTRSAVDQPFRVVDSDTMRTWEAMQMRWVAISEMTPEFRIPDGVAFTYVGTIAGRVHGTGEWRLARDPAFRVGNPNPNLDRLPLAFPARESA